MYPDACGHQWKVGLVDSLTVNAYVTPKFMILITEDLLNALQSTKRELAALIEHKMKHIIHKHHKNQKVASITFGVASMVFAHAMGVNQSITHGVKHVASRAFTHQDEYETAGTCKIIVALNTICSL